MFYQGGNIIHRARAAFKHKSAPVLSEVVQISSSPTIGELRKIKGGVGTRKRIASSSSSKMLHKLGPTD